jgi:hypothetical protein
MDLELAQRVARNEATFRDVNETLQRGRWPGEGKATAFLCECAQLWCTRLIELTPQDYERIRAHPRRFLVALGHDVPDVESIVERHRGYVVVEKREEAGEVAEITDPRS